MATKKKNNKPKSNVSKSKQLTHFRFKWWMAVVGVGVVAVIGIIIVRFSFAGAGLSEAEIDSYWYYNNGYRDARVSNDGNYSYKTYRKNGQIGACYFSPSNQQAANSWNTFFSGKSTNNSNGTILVGRWYPSKKCI